VPIRATVGARSVDDLLEHRLDLSEQLREPVATTAPDLGVQVESVQLRDVMLPGTLRSAFAEVLQARAEARRARNAPAANPQRCAAWPTRHASWNPHPGS